MPDAFGEPTREDVENKAISVAQRVGVSEADAVAAVDADMDAGATPSEELAIVESADQEMNGAKSLIDLEAIQINEEING